MERTATAEWPVWSTSARVVVTEAAGLAAARSMLRTYLSEVDAACSRFRADSEIRRLTARAGQPVLVSALLAEYVRAALSAAHDSGGDVDPTVGAALIGLGYDRDFSLLLPASLCETGSGSDVSGDRSVAATVIARSDWRAVDLDGRTLTVPEGVSLDLGATAKALAADHGARLIADRLGCGVLVSLGGDIATAGPAPAGDWQVLVEDRPGEPACRITLPEGAALATSSTLRRRWWRGGNLVHHIVDPRTGVAADPVWRTVSVAAGSCIAANVAATAAIVRGREGLAGLRRGGLPARLVGRDREIVRLCGWPEPAGSDDRPRRTEGES
ncbi:FAD:protein FMN transferase [Nocardia heshunensis]